MRRGRAAERRERRESLAEKLAARPREVNLGGGRAGAMARFGVFNVRCGDLAAGCMTLC